MADSKSAALTTWRHRITTGGILAQGSLVGKFHDGFIVKNGRFSSAITTANRSNLKDLAYQFRPQVLATRAIPLSP